MTLLNLHTGSILLTPLFCFPQLTGCGLIGCGVWLNVARDDWEGISDYSYMSVANIAIAAGVIVVMVAFLGCCGAITENKIMLLVVSTTAKHVQNSIDGVPIN